MNMWRLILTSRMHILTIELLFST